MPLTFEALKGQRYRWCFGGIQILRMHWRSLLPGRRTAANRLTAGQRWTYLAGGLQWYGDLLGLAFYLLLLAGAANLADGGGQLFRKLTPFLVAAVPALVALGLVRAVALLRRGTGASWRDAIGAFFIWQSTSLAVARVSVLGLFSRRAAFLRTPKTSENGSWWQALAWPHSGHRFPPTCATPSTSPTPASSPSSIPTPTPSLTPSALPSVSVTPWPVPGRMTTRYPGPE